MTQINANFPEPEKVNLNLTGVPPCQHSEFQTGCRRCEQWRRMRPEERQGTEHYDRTNNPDLYKTGNLDPVPTLERIKNSPKAPKADWINLGRADVWAKLLEAQQAEQQAEQQAAQPQPAADLGDDKPKPKTSGFVAKPGQWLGNKRLCPDCGAVMCCGHAAKCRKKKKNDPTGQI